MPRHARFATVTANVCKDMHLHPFRLRSREFTRRVHHDVTLAASLGSLVGWQEMETAVHWAALRSLDGWQHYAGPGAAAAVPISWDAAVWEKVDAGYTPATRGWAKVSPARYVTWVILRHKATGQTVARVNTQTISGGWSKGWRRSTKDRRKFWARHVEVLREVIATEFPAQVPIIAGGDLNRDALRHPEPAVGVTWDQGREPTHGRRVYDYLGHVGRLRVIGRRLRKGYSDHRFSVVEYELG